ncbi:hypothetical protein B0H14DRAFT_3584332 [Mycena olivaceomarginata]|nr:hypothetical protein B0H14DRAFT_3584332 [Mycena olivaceomarginata]
MSSDSDSTPSAPLSAADAHALYRYGLDITQDAIGVIWETIFISAYGVFFAVAIYSILLQVANLHRHALRRRLPLCKTSLTLWALNVTYWFKTAHALLIDDPNMPLSDRPDRANENLASLGPPMEALFMFNMVVGGHRRYLAGMGPLPENALGGRYPLHNAAYVLQQHRRSMKALNIVGNPRRMTTDKMLSLLVESASSTLRPRNSQLTQLILFFDIDREKPIIYVYELFSGMGDQISGMYPTLIIVIVNFHQTITVQWGPGSKRSVPTDTLFSHGDNGIQLDSVAQKELDSGAGGRNVHSGSFIQYGSENV